VARPRNHHVTEDYHEYRNRPDTPRRQKRIPAEGFSLIELMVVVAIIGILGMIALPQYPAVLGQGKAGRCPRRSRREKSALNPPRRRQHDHLAGIDWLARVKLPLYLDYGGKRCHEWSYSINCELRATLQSAVAA
jgi:prepilin-type N-terminal cleavage/methylation domain-containing protein